MTAKSRVQKLNSAFFIVAYITGIHWRMWTLFDNGLNLIETDYDMYDPTPSKILHRIRYDFMENGSRSHMIKYNASHFIMCEKEVDYRAKYVIHATVDEVIIYYKNTIWSSASLFNNHCRQLVGIIESMPWMSTFDKYERNRFRLISCVSCDGDNVSNNYSICKNCDNIYGKYMKHKCAKVMLLTRHMTSVDDMNDMIKQNYMLVISKNILDKFSMVDFQH
jgi:hypothetical protein